MVQGILSLIFWGYSWPDRDVPYGVPILILTHKMFVAVQWMFFNILWCFLLSSLFNCNMSSCSKER